MTLRPPCFERFAEGVVDFEAVAMALGDGVGAKGLMRQTAARQEAGIAAEAHGRALVADAALLGHEVDDAELRLSEANSRELAFLMPQTLRAYSTTATCSPRHRPR